MLRRAVDLLLSVFPFEVAFLKTQGVPVQYVGHPLANTMPLVPDRAVARKALQCRQDQPVLALLPGSRRSEIDALAKPFLEAAEICRRALPELQILVPMVSRQRLDQFCAIQRSVAPDLPLRIGLGESREALAAADIVLTASGTATLEALLCKRPMVVGYRVHPLTYWLAKHLKLIKVEHIAMANLLADERLAPEFIQHECSADRLAAAVLRMLHDPERMARIQERYQQIHQQLRRDSDREAAAAVLGMLNWP